LSEKTKLALVELLGSGGPESIVGGGSVVMSIVQTWLVAPLSLPSWSRALTWKLWLPSLRPV
jgi:hypothetical protein